MPKFTSIGVPEHVRDMVKYFAEQADQPMHVALLSILEDAAIEHGYLQEAQRQSVPYADLPPREGKPDKPLPRKLPKKADAPQPLPVLRKASEGALRGAWGGSPLIASRAGDPAYDEVEGPPHPKSIRRPLSPDDDDGADGTGFAKSLMEMRGPDFRVRGTLGDTEDT